MANLSSLLGGGGVKNITHFRKLAAAQVASFAGTVDITSAGLTSTAKAMLVPTGQSEYGGVGNQPVALSINSTTQVVYTQPNATTVDFAFSIIEYN